MASENIMMQAVEKGGNRQELHERLRQHAIAVASRSRKRVCPTICGTASPLHLLLATKEEIEAGLVPETFVAVLPEVDKFVAHVLQPVSTQTPKLWQQHAALSV